jgi:RNA methyltransferase, TrmH family
MRAQKTIEASMTQQLIELSNSRETRIRKLLQKKYRQEFGAFLLEGSRIVEDALANDGMVDSIIIAESRIHQFDDIIKLAASTDTALYRSPDKTVELLSSTVNEQGILAVANIPSSGSAQLYLETGEPIVVLHEVSDPGNLGTIIRTCDWFGFERLVLSTDSADPYNPKCVRASMGSILRVQVSVMDSYEAFFKDVRARSYSILATVAEGKNDIYATPIPAKSVILFGSEAHGLPSRILNSADLLLSIPSFGKAESLNLASAHAIILSMYRHQPRSNG